MSERNKINTIGVVSEDLIQFELSRKANRKERITQALPYAGIVLLIIFFGIVTRGKFLELKNLQLLLNQCFTMAIVMVGAVFLYSLGSLDMAIGQVLAVNTLILAQLYNRDVPLLICVLVGMAVSVGLMCVTATAKNYFKVDAFIASMCVANASSGIVVVVTKATKITFPYSKAPWLSSPSVKVLVLATMVFIGYIVYNYTSIGKSLKSIGGNPIVASVSGIDVKKATYMAYIAVGIAIGVGALFTVARSGAVDPSIGSGMNLNIMIAVVLGGFPLSGGANARFSAPIIGALIVTVLTNGLAMLGQANALGYGIKGLLFIVVVVLTYEKSKGKLIS